MKVAALHPSAEGSLASWLFISRSAMRYVYDDVEFYEHVSFLKYMANFMATPSITSDIMDIDSVYDYLLKLSSSRTPEILSILASVLLK